MSKNALIVFVKNPIIGKAKTRLAAAIGDEKALEVYHQLLSRTKDITQNLDGNKYLFYSDFIDENDKWNSLDFIKKLQSKNDLGAKMFNAFESVFKENEKVMIIGSDCYDLTTETLEKAFLALNESDTVIGPANDGGYYLLGMNNLYKELFFEIEWSTDKVLKTTIEKINKLNLSYHLLPELIDVDTITDLKSTNLYQKYKAKLP